MLCDAVHYGATYDQLNLPSLAMAEVLSRRIELICEAYSNPSKPCWDAARYYVGVGTLEDVVPASFRSYVARRARDDAEIANARSRTSQLRGAPGGGATSPGDPGEGLPDAGRGRGRGRGRSRAVPPAGDPA